MKTLEAKLSTVEEIQAAVLRLPRAEAARLAAWPAERDAALWDEQMEADAALTLLPVEAGEEVALLPVPAGLDAFLVAALQAQSSK